MSQEDSLKSTILKSELPDIIKTVGEISIDSLLDEGIIKELPVLKTFVSIGKTFNSIRDYFFAKKMMKFLKCISEMPEEERETLVSKLEKDPDFGEYAGERIAELLSRIDGEVKPTLVATALKLYAKEEISSSELQHLNYAINRFLLCDKTELIAFCSQNSNLRATDSNPVTANFISSGLGYVESGYGGSGVHPTATAHLLLRVIKEAGA